MALMLDQSDQIPHKLLAQLLPGASHEEGTLDVGEEAIAIEDVVNMPVASI